MPFLYVCYRGMTKIKVRVVLLDEGVFLMHPETKLVFQYAAPHKLVGKIDFDRYKLIKTGRI